MNYLNDLVKQTSPVVGTTVDTVLPPSLSGADEHEKILGTLRRAQLHDLCRSYGILDAKLERLSHHDLVRKLGFMAGDGFFNKPPRDRWHFERARFDSDLCKNAKNNPDAPGVAIRRATGTMGFEAVPIPFLMAQRSEDDAPVVSRPKAKTATAAPSAAGPSMAELRDKARELGISSFGKSRRDILSQISAAESAAATKQEDVPNATA